MNLKEFVDNSLFKSTGFKCVDGESTRLECEENNIIIITRVISGRSNSNSNCSEIDDDESVSEYEYDFKEKCNGERTCVFKLPKKKHLIGEYKSKATFESNRINIIYSCVPSKCFLIIFIDKLNIKIYIKRKHE